MIRDYSHLIEPANIPSCPVCQKALQQGDAGSQIILHGCYALAHEDCIDNVSNNVTENRKLLELRFIQIINAVCGYEYFHLSYPESLHQSDDYHEKIQVSPASFLEEKFKKQYCVKQFDTGYGPLQLFNPTDKVKNNEHAFYVVAHIDGQALSMLMYQFEGFLADNREIYECINAAIGEEYICTSEAKKSKREILNYFEKHTIIEYGTLDSLHCMYQYDKTIHTQCGKLEIFHDDDDETVLAIQMTLILMEFPRIAYVPVEDFKFICSLTK